MSMDSTISSISSTVTDCGLGFAVENAGSLADSDPIEALDAIIWQADRILAPTSESSLWGMFRGDNAADDEDKARWWANVYSAAIAAHERDDDDAYDQIITDVAEGNGDRYQS